jgi:excisionase family DNA binding protein
VPTKSMKKDGACERKPQIRKLPPPTTPLDPLQRYRLLEAAAYLRVSHMTLYKDIKAGKVKVIREGARTLVPGTEIAARSQAAA